MKTPKPETSEPALVPYKELKRVCLVRQYNGKYQYRLEDKHGNGNWLYADSKQGAIETASEIYRRTPNERRLTKSERYAKSRAERIAEFDRNYGHLSLEDLRGLIADARKVKGTSVEREMNDGKRRTRESTVNQGFRDAGEFILQMTLYLRERELRLLREDLMETKIQPPTDTDMRPKLLRRPGLFRIKRDLIRTAPDAVLHALRDVLVVRAEMLYAFDAIEYHGYSMHFEPVGDLAADTADIPEYIAQITQRDDTVTVRWVKWNDTP